MLSSWTSTTGRIISSGPVEMQGSCVAMKSVTRSYPNAVCRLDEEDEEEDNAGTEAPLKQQQNGAAADDLWVPVTLGLGLPLTPDKLCIAVCGRAGASNFLDVCHFHRHYGAACVLMPAWSQTRSIESRSGLRLEHCCWRHGIHFDFLLVWSRSSMRALRSLVTLGALLLASQYALFCLQEIKQGALRAVGSSCSAGFPASTSSKSTVRRQVRLCGGFCSLVCRAAQDMYDDFTWRDHPAEGCGVVLCRATFGASMPSARPCCSSGCSSSSRTTAHAPTASAARAAARMTRWPTWTCPSTTCCLMAPRCGDWITPISHRAWARSALSDAPRIVACLHCCLMVPTHGGGSPHWLGVGSGGVLLVDVSQECSISKGLVRTSSAVGFSSCKCAGCRHGSDCPPKDFTSLGQAYIQNMKITWVSTS